jgi:hypothetical protein
MKHWTNEELQQVLLQVTQLAAIDAEFRTLALKDGAAAVARICPKALPEGMSFIFVDNSGPRKTIPLPDPVPNSSDQSDQLDECELEEVAGGGDPAPPPPPLSGGWSKIAGPSKTGNRARLQRSSR